MTLVYTVLSLAERGKRRERWNGEHGLKLMSESYNCPTWNYKCLIEKNKGKQMCIL